MLALSADQVAALAPDAAAVAAGRKLAAPKSWKNLGRSDRAVWGECQGSALYQTRVSLTDFASRCSCPSRKFPCKHALGLLFLAASDGIAEGQEPEWVAEWVAKRGESAKDREERSAARAAKMADPAAQAKRAQKRQESVVAGLDAMDAWLEDLVRQGLSRLDGASPSLWESQARRLIDAQASGLAARVRRIGEVVGSHPGWPVEVLDQLGLMALLSHAYRRLDELAPALQHDVRQLVGHSLEQAEVLAGGDLVEDCWHVLAGSIEDEDRLRVQRAWLRGERSGRMALVLQFAAGSARFTDVLMPDTRFIGVLAFWPGAVPRRALVHKRETTQRGVSLTPGTRIEAFLAQYADALARQPWLERELAVLTGVVPVVTTSGAVVVDTKAKALPLAGRDHHLLLSISGGHPVDLVAEWDGYRLRALSASADGRLVSLQERADG